MYVVAGATGQTGAAAAATLLEAGKRVRALVREPARAALLATRGAELAVADLTDAGALTRAFEGAAGAYVLAPPPVAAPDPIGFYEQVAKAVARAARAAGLPRLVMLSSEGAHLPAGTGPIRGLHRAEAILAGAVPSLTVLRATYFQENWASVAPVAAAQGVLPTFLADPARRRAMVATADIGRLAAELLLEDGPPAMVELEGPEDYSAADAAAAMAAVVGRPVVPVQPPREAWVSILTGAGLGQAYAELIAEMYDGINSGHVRFSGEGRRVRGRVPLAETIRGLAAAKAA